MAQPFANLIWSGTVPILDKLSERMPIPLKIMNDASAAAMGDGATVTIASSPVMPGAAFVTVTPPGLTKATAIAEIAHELATSVDRVMMVGDGHNDLEAIAAVGHGTAMGNAEPEVKAAARHHVASVAEDGLAEALELSALLTAC